MAKVKFKLNHWCERKGCVGSPGDVIEVSQSDADYLSARGGGEVVTEPSPAVEVAEDSVSAEAVSSDAPATAGPVAAESAPVTAAADPALVASLDLDPAIIASLAAAGVTTVAQAHAVPSLTALPGIDKASAKKIKVAIGDPPDAE